MANILVIAGSDSSSHAGMQVDLKVAQNLGIFATSVISAITCQNSQKVKEIFPIPLKIIKNQIIAIAEDIEIKAIKIGMVCGVEILQEIIDLLKIYFPKIPIIWDPVFSSSTQANLFNYKQADLAILQKDIFPNIFLFTPNIPEALQLLNIEQGSPNKIITSLAQYKLGNILLKTGHSIEKNICDLLYSDKSITEYKHQRLSLEHGSRGTGCSLATAITCFIVQENSLQESIKKAEKYIFHSLQNTIKIGKGKATLSHLSQ